ncbi:MAG: UvrB/UvrC motif-containing protein [Patescibacteria group bacterium]
MNGQYLSKAKLPDSPGVYFFKHGSDVLYIGKATSLKDRVRSYFVSDLVSTRGPLLVDMIFQADKLDWQETDSVLEALILEVELIKKFQPKYNSKEKDDKSFNCIVVTDEDFPQVLIIRKNDIDFSSLTASAKGRISPGLKQLKAIFGPFPHGTQLKEALKIVRRIFPFRDNKCKLGQGRPCFNRQIGLCPGTCTGEITKQEYARTVRNIKLFFEGKKGILLKQLERDMKELAKKQEFEKAALVRQSIFALNHIQDVALIKSEKTISSDSAFRIEAYDIAHLSGKDTVGVMTVIVDGEPAKAEYRKFRIKRGDGAHDIANLREIVERRLAHTDWTFPHMIVADGNEVQNRVIEEVLAKANIQIPVVAVTKDERHKARAIIGDAKLVDTHKKAILLANSEAHRFAIGYHRKLRGEIFKNG